MMAMDTTGAEWIRHRDAAELMKRNGFIVNEKKLRLVDEAGNWKHYPELERRREGRLITMNQRQVEEWLADRAAAAAAKTRRKPLPPAGSYVYAFADVLDHLKSSGAGRAARVLERRGY